LRKYWLQRLGAAIGLLLAVSALTFGAMNLLGDPLVNILGPIAGSTEPEDLETIASAEAEYNLDDPLPIRYVKWASAFVTGDFGVQFSIDGEPPVSNLIKERLPRTLMLLIMAQTMAISVAVPWALLAASKADKAVDKISTVTAFLFIAVPNVGLAVILKYLFALKFSIFPLIYSASDPFWSRVWQMMLPAISLALPAAAIYQRLLRTDLITTLQEDYILTARSKGVSKRNVLFKHALRPSLFSFITIVGITTGALLGGSLIVEQVFIIPGLGSAIVEAILRDDFPVVLAIVMIITAAFVMINIFVDLIYSLIDPRVRAE
jgi:peptide/nickel transport system permease protein